MRPVVGSIGVVLAVAMLLPGAIAPAAFAQDESVAPSASVAPDASVEPSAAPLPDAFVELFVDYIAADAFEGPAHPWDIAVEGGTPSVNELTLEPNEIGYYGAFTVAVAGQSATVDMTVALSPPWELSLVGCLDDLDPPTEIDPTVTSRGFVLEVAPGRRYSCSPTIDDLGAEPPTVPPEEQPGAETLPATDTLAGDPSGPSSDGWPMVIWVLVGVASASLLIVRPSPGRTVWPLTPDRKSGPEPRP